MTPKSPSRTPRPFALRHDKEGWWFYAGHMCDDEPWWGPWATKALAGDAVTSWKRNNIHVMHPRDITSDWKARKRRAG